MKLSIATLMLLSAGCGKLVPVEGTVTLDGNPLEGAMVTFMPEDKAVQEGGPKTAHAATNSDGRFRLETNTKIGAFPGKYKVTVSRTKMEIAPGADPNEHIMRLMMTGQAKQVQTLPARYADIDQTPIRLEVPRSGVKDLQIAVASGSGAAKSE